MKLADNPLVRELIMQRLHELDWKASDLLKDAYERGREISKERYSKWKGKKPGGLNDNDLIWIMERLGIQYNVNFGKPVIRAGKLVYDIGKYDELQALKRVNLLFGHGKEK